MLWFAVALDIDKINFILLCFRSVFVFFTDGLKSILQMALRKPQEKWSILFKASISLSYGYRSAIGPTI